LASRSVLLPSLVGIFVLVAGLAIADPWRQPVSSTQSLLPPGLPGITDAGTGSLALGVGAFVRGDLRQSRLHLEQLLRSERLREDDRIRGHFLQGWVNARLGHHQQASSHFYRVRKAEGHPLEELASFFEARADLKRGHVQTALAECETYRTRWPEGGSAEECLLLEADAYIALGKFEAAVGRYESFLKAKPDDKRLEPVRVRIAQSLEAAGRWREAAQRYRQLYLHHSLPTTAKVATAGWRRMVQGGYVQESFTDRELYRRALSLRSAAQFDDSMELYEQLDARNPGVGDGANALGKEVDAARHSFLWRNRKYGPVGERNAKLYDQAPDHPEAAERLHWTIEGLTRSGEYVRASHYLDIALKRFPSHSRFRRKFEKHMKIYDGASRYEEASSMLTQWVGASSRARKKSRTRFLKPYYSYRAGKYAEAIAGFDGLAQGPRRQKAAALYYRGKAKLATGDRRGGRADHRALSRDFPDSWYSVVLRSRYRQKQADPALLALARNGRWPGASQAETPYPAPLANPSSAAVVSRLAQPRPPRFERLEAPLHPPVRDSDGRPTPVSFDGWSWPGLMSLGKGSDSGVDGTLATSPKQTSATSQRPSWQGDALERVPFDPDRVPPTWEPSSLWDPQEAAELWSQFAEEHEELWPELPVAYELSVVGLYELAGPILAQIHKEVRDLRRNKRARARVSRWRAAGGKLVDPTLERWSRILELEIGSSDWRQIFGAAGYPASVTAFALESVPFSQHSRQEPEGRALWTLSYPAAFAPYVWRAGWEHDVDPLLMLAVTRVESRYRHDAVSHAGAIGLVQIMPATGHRVAALMGEHDFRVDRLVEPGLNIRMGTFYLGELMRRFGDRQFALAVGSYNGGPHNVGRWLRQKQGIPFEEFVEEIQFDETRKYTKRVLEYYAVYLELYGGGSWPLLPQETSQDRPEVINF